MTAWLVRGGRTGEWETWALAGGFAGGGFSGVPSIASCKTREDVIQLIAAALPEKPPRAHTNYGGQLWALRDGIKPGDLVIMPLKTTKKIAIGTCISGYEYLPNEDPGKRHSVRVEWVRRDVSRADLRQDLLFSLGAFMTICEISRNDAEIRLRRVMSGDKDPGAEIHLTSRGLKGQERSVHDEQPDQVDIEAIALDSIRTRLVETFQSHQLAALTAAILQIKGLTCTVSPPGPDKGIDIIAGSGPLGLDSPRLVVQCKSGTSPVDNSVIQRLQGALGSIGAEQALLVAFGGLTRAAEEMLTNQQFRVKVWDADALLEAFLEVYELLDGEVRETIPLKRIWTVIDQAE
jgi:restriction system protein